MEYLTFGLSITGAVLGIINYFYSWNRDKVRLIIKPKWYYAYPTEHFSVEVINISTFDIYVSEISFYVGQNQKLMDMTNLHIFPIQLKPRENRSVVFDSEFHKMPEVSRLKYIQIFTSCNEKFKLKGKIIKKLKNQ
ncbi:MAG: hypothetical protein IT280_04745 [Ignavibacteria bacterium]|nr:hypothetical protein [Ignavibacteria bacterium]